MPPYKTKAAANAAQARFRVLHPDVIKENNRRSHAKLRADLLKAYGDRCNCCGEAEPIFLTIDHLIPPDDRKRRGMLWLRDLRKNGYPKGYITACFNCNLGRYRNGGVCPHQTGGGLRI